MSLLTINNYDEKLPQDARNKIKDYLENMRGIKRNAREDDKSMIARILRSNPTSKEKKDFVNILNNNGVTVKGDKLLLTPKIETNNESQDESQNKSQGPSRINQVSPHIKSAAKAVGTIGGSVVGGLAGGLTGGLISGFAAGYNKMTSPRLTGNAEEKRRKRIEEAEELYCHEKLQEIQDRKANPAAPPPAGPIGGPHRQQPHVVIDAATRAIMDGLPE
jgi:outer membrane lipoprotein SlyB